MGRPVGQAEGCHGADLLTGQRLGLFGRGERDSTYAEAIADRVVRIEAVRAKDDTGRVAGRIRLADHDDGVGRILEPEAIRRTEGRRIGQRRVTGEQFVFPAANQPGFEARSVVVLIHARNGSV